MNRPRKLLRTAVVATAAALLLAGCSANGAGNGDNAGSGGAADPMTIKLSYVNPPTSIDGQILEEVAAAVEERTDGEIVIELYPSGQIGTTGDTAQQAANGEDIIAYMDASIIAQLGAEDFGILGGPFLFANADEANTFLESEVFAEMAEEAASDLGIRILAFNWLDGPRHIWAKKPAPQPSDLEGLRFRTPPVDVWTETFSLLGAVPTEIANTETYSALEQGVVDAAEGPINGTYALGWHEVANVATLTEHFRTLIGFGTSEVLWQRLTDEQRAILEEEFIAGGVEAQKRYAAAIDETMAKMESESGVTFVEADIEAYQEATRPFYDKYGDLLDRVRDAAK
ncbi:TRAP transporter substrate-binding protein DctP [Microbacterium aurum]|uniref:TRAP transporter substrate-binding protein DctP n=1 Tax=Microbacterium aurum TaxID=36805 RepID=UPI0009FCD7EB|nr:TRAP transporter substrate-binding protein DctP [Microbacterium aurum]MBM7826027.1 TRAP-type C4-dicarboxylate transport system substrate-binding protein [Microbacterium aurum]